MLYLKYNGTGKYVECGMNKDGNFYFLFIVQVQRGMGHQKADELLIYGMNKKFIDRFLQKENAVIVYREDKVADSDLLRLTSEEIKGKNLG